MKKADQLSKSLDALRTAVHGGVTALQQTLTSSGGDTLSVILDGEFTAAAVSEKLAAIAALYRDIAALISPTPDSYPLRVIRIESGSLAFSLSGDPLVVQVVTAVFTTVLGLVVGKVTQTDV